MIIEYKGVEFDVEYAEKEEVRTSDHPGAYTIIITSVFLNGYDAIEYVNDLLDYFKECIHEL